jgi:hypothetical protein
VIAKKENTKYQGSLLSTEGFFDSIDKIDPEFFVLHPISNVFLNAEYFRSIERAGFQGLSFRYYLHPLKDGSFQFQYFQLLDLSTRDLESIVNLDPYGKVLTGLSGVLDKFIFGIQRNKPHYLVICGNMLMSGNHGLYCGSGNHQALLETITKVKQDLSKSGKVAAMIVKDFEADRDALGPLLKKDKFHSMIMDPIMEMDLAPSWKSFSDYLAAMSSKYRVRTNNVRKKLADTSIKQLSLADVEEHYDRLEFLYKSVQQKSPIRLMQCSFLYLKNLMMYMPDKLVMEAYIENGEIIAFLCGIKNGKSLEAHHIGIDYKYNKSHALYQNILYDFIEMGIQESMNHVSFGRTAMEMKSTVGAVPVTYNAYIRFENRVVNSLICHFLPDEPAGDWVQRNPFK